jgi:uncharacterized protein YjbJ (UPF0337 family)
MANERIDEFKGSVKEGAGKLTDDPQLEAEGRGEKDIARAERTIKGVGDQVKGAIEQGVGKVTGDHESHAEGKVDSAKGDIERIG